MTRAPFNVLVIPFLRSLGQAQLYCVLRRSDANYWQWVAGGGEDKETPIQAARRETREETAIEGVFFALDARDHVPKTAFAAHVTWPPGIYVIPQYTFAVEASSMAVVLSREHSEAIWLPYREAYDRLRWQSNQTALWELSERLQRDDLHPAPDDPPFGLR